MNTTSLIQILRERTAEEHAFIEGAMPVMQPHFNTDHYGKLLLKLYGFYAPFEKLIEKNIGAFAEKCAWNERSKLNWLETDIQQLAPTINLKTIPQCTQLPQINSTAAVVGALYVAEGSTLGGTVIEKHLHAKPEFADKHLQFFTSYGANTGKMWRNFLMCAEAEVPAAQYDEATEAAKETFKALRLWLTQN